MPVLDSMGMFGLAEGLPEQVAAAAAGARGLGGLPAAEEVEHVVVLGMGGSGVAGDILLAAAAPLLPVPVVVAKSYECPAFVGEGSLVFAVSVSGDTEETLQAATDAAVSGARMVVVTSGGELARLATGWEVPVIRVPAGFPQPRSAIGAVSIPPMVVLEEIGLLKGATYWIDAAVEQLGRRRDELAAGGPDSRAAELARRIGGTIPLVQGGGALGAAAAGRWRTQINENAKSPAFSSTQPELCHNEVCGWATRGEVTRSGVTVVQLRHDGEHPQIGRRFELVRALLEPAVAGVVEVRAEGEGDLAQLFDLILFGDYVSLWMAAEAGIDPGPVDVLNDLKRQLSS